MTHISFKNKWKKRAPEFKILELLDFAVGMEENIIISFNLLKLVSPVNIFILGSEVHSLVLLPSWVSFYLILFEGLLCFISWLQLVGILKLPPRIANFALQTHIMNVAIGGVEVGGIKEEYPWMVFLIPFLLSDIVKFPFLLSDIVKFHLAALWARLPLFV